MEQPPSPATSPAELGLCIHRLLKFIQQSRVDGSLDVGLCLSADYYGLLLRVDPLTTAAEPDSAPHAPSVSADVPEYPLYKRLAVALHEAILSGGMPERSDGCSCSNLAFSSQGDGESLKHVFDELISRYEAELLDDYEECVVWNSCSGALLLAVKRFEPLSIYVQCIHHYAFFYEMLEGEDLEKVYRKFYSEEKEISNGVLDIRFSKSSAQPYICLARILSGLSYKGIQQLLGFVHAVGTVSESLPPPASVLLSAFQQPCNPDEKGSILTEGARDLAKHINRVVTNTGGDFKGSQSSKNKSAIDVFLSLMSTCCWRNLHVVPPHGCVLELRDSNGFGASLRGGPVMVLSLLNFWSRLWRMDTPKTGSTETATIQIPGNLVCPSADLKYDNGEGVSQEVPAKHGLFNVASTTASPSK